MKKKYILIISSIILVVIVLIGLYIKNPLFYISKYTVSSAVALETKEGYKLTDEDKNELIDILSSVKIGSKKEGNYLDLIQENFTGGEPYMFKIKLKWNMNLQVNVDTRLRYCIIINNKHAYECDKDSYQKLKKLYTHIHNENYELSEKGKELLNDILKNY